MSRSAVHLALPKYLVLIFLFSFTVSSLTGCSGEDAFTTDGSTNNTQDPNNSPGTGTPPPPSTATAVYLGTGAGTNFRQGVLNVGITTPLSANGSTTITGMIADENGNPYTSPVQIEFTSTCIENGTASIESPMTSFNGMVQSTYRAEGCAGTDVILATGTAGSSNLSASGSITIQSGTVGAIEFVSADPETISLEGTAGLGLTESSTVTFRVVDNAGRPVSGANVNFSLSTTVGGITLNQISSTTIADGTAQVTVSSGTVNTSVRVVASADTGTAIVTTQSVALAISTGVPDKNSFDIAATTLRPTAWQCDGEQVTITAYASDHFNNPAPDGTAIAFRTEAGSIQGSCNTVDGKCSVTWESSGDRPTDGRTTILATVLGEESYVDTAPSNGRFDDGETYTDLGEAFLDSNEDGIRDGIEEYIDFNSNGSYDGPDGSFNGVLCNTGATQCSTDSPLLTISDEVVLVMASRNQNLAVLQPQLNANNEIVLDANGDIIFQDIANTNDEITVGDDGNTRLVLLEFSDIRGQQPPSGSTISVSTTTGELVGATSTDIAEGNEAGPASFIVSLKTTDANPEPGVLTVTLNMPASACDAGETLEFSTPISFDDVTSPSVVSSTPAHNDTDVALNVDISVEFDDDMTANTFTPASVILENYTNPTSPQPVATYNSEYDAARRTLTVYVADGTNPGETLQADTRYRLSLTNAIQDDAGNPLFTGAGSDYIAIVFRTAATTP